MGTLSSLAAYCSTDYIDIVDFLILGTPGLVRYIQNHLYGYYILSAGFGVYLCEYSIWNLVWCYDTGY